MNPDDAARDFLSLAREQAEDVTWNLKDAMARYEAIGNPAYANACRSTLRRAEAVLTAVTNLHDREIASLDGAP
jgi:hypothetical protein